MTIRQAQCLLEYLGYEPGVIDGANGPNTRDAVMAFQRAEGLAVDGIAGANTQSKLLEAVAQGRFYAPQEPVSKPAATGGDAAQYLQADGCYHIPRGVDVPLTKNFSAREIHCQGVGCCTESVISKRIMDLAQTIRDDLGEPPDHRHGWRLWVPLQGAQRRNQRRFPHFSAYHFRGGGFALQRPGQAQGRGSAASDGRRGRPLPLGLPCRVLG